MKNSDDQSNPYAKNDGDYPEEVRIQRERDRLAANSNPNLHDKISKILVKWSMPTRQAAISEIVQLVEADSNAKAGSEVRDIDVPKLAGSEELPSKIRCITGECPAGHENCIYKDFDDDMVEPRTNSIMDIVSQAIAQSSAQAEMRGRAKELEWLNGVFDDELRSEISKRLAQLRAQGGENK